MKEKTLSEKFERAELITESIDTEDMEYAKAHLEGWNDCLECLEDDVKEAVEEAEDFVISMKRDDDKVWNMRLNLIIEEFRTKIFGDLK